MCRCCPSLKWGVWARPH
uniref:Uncharacterized protein n=1 Tax=Arundo donax TaxID=35708 RepID=A0A0A9BQH0_ARUDO